MKLENLPIWPRILEKRHTIKTTARSPIGILRAVLSAGGLHQAGPALEWCIPQTTGPRSGLQALDIYCESCPGAAQPHHKHYETRAGKLTQQMRDSAREKADPKFRRAAVRRRLAEKQVRDLVLHIADRWHNTVRPMFRSKYASFRWGRGTTDHVEWDRYSKKCKWPCKYSDAGAGIDDDHIYLSPVGATEIVLPRPSPKLIRAADLAEPHPIGLFAIPVPEQDGVFACMGVPKNVWAVVGFCVRGRRVPECVARGTTTLADIEGEQNAETRQVMIERYGPARYVLESGAAEIDHSDLGTLYSVHGMKVVKVVNSTPEPDGSYKDYWLRVPGEIETAAAAVAWTFGLKPEEYQPVVES